MLACFHISNLEFTVLHLQEQRHFFCAPTRKAKRKAWNGSSMSGISSDIRGGLPSRLYGRPALSEATSGRKSMEIIHVVIIAPFRV
jgi:hypothetical protein